VGKTGPGIEDLRETKTRSGLGEDWYENCQLDTGLQQGRGVTGRREDRKRGSRGKRKGHREFGGEGGKDEKHNVTGEWDRGKVQRGGVGINAERERRKDGENVAAGE